MRFPLLPVLLGAVLVQQPVAAQTRLEPLNDLSSHQVDTQQLRSALSSRTLTWLTGTSANNDYISVGRLANFFGFVALRVSSGHSLTRAHVARDTLAVLDDSQRAAIARIVGEQEPAHAETLAARKAMNRALEGLLVGEKISGEAFLELGRAYGAAEAELGRVIAQRFGEIARTLTPGQQEALSLVRSAHAAGRPELAPQPEGQVELPEVDRQELVNLAARFLSWTTGTPEQNDFEVVGKPSQHFGFVSLRLASGHGVRRGAVAQEVQAILTPAQRRMLNRAVAQNVETFDDFLAARSQLMRTLETALEGETIDAERVRTAGAAMGEIEAEMTWAQAHAMLGVRNTLSDEQSNLLLAMRTRYSQPETDATERDPVSRGRQLFAQCALCHAERGNGIAPSLVGVLGRRIAGDPGYDAYSPAMKDFAAINGIWTAELIEHFLASPRDAVPGTTMGFDGFGDQSDRAAVAAYLATLD